MSTFRYRAMSSDGRHIRAEMDAADLNELEARLHSQGLVFINGEALRTVPWLRPRVPRHELIHFCFHLEQLLEAGVPPFDSLSALRDATSHTGMRAVVSALITDIERGQPLSEAAARQPAVFTPIVTALLRAGEQSGRLPEAVRDIGKALEHEAELIAYARRIAIYPAIVASLMLLALVVALVHVVPELEKLFRSSGQTLPLATRVLIGLSHAVTQGWWAILGAALLSIGAAQWTLTHSATARVRLHHLLLRLPIIGELQIKIALARFAAVLARLYASGITVIDALHITQDAAGNLAVRDALRSATRQIEQGHSLADRKSVV